MMMMMRPYRILESDWSGRVDSFPSYHKRDFILHADWSDAGVHWFCSPGCNANKRLILFSPYRITEGFLLKFWCLLRTKMPFFSILLWKRLARNCLSQRCSLVSETFRLYSCPPHGTWIEEGLAWTHVVTTSAQIRMESAAVPNISESRREWLTRLF